MNKKGTSDFIWGIIGNIVASLFISLANILVGRYFPNAPREVLDVASLLLPLLIIFVFLYRDKIGKIHIEPYSWFFRIREIFTQTPQMEQIRELFLRFIRDVRQFMSRQSLNWVNYLEKATKPSVIIVTLITVFFIVGFGVSIRWLFEQRTITTLPSIYNSYRQIYDLLAP